MVQVIYVDVVCNGCRYANFIIKRNNLIRCDRSSEALLDQEVTPKPSRRKLKLCVDGILLHYFVQELCMSPVYYSSFMDTFCASTNSNINAIKVVLVPPSKEIIDYTWNYRTTHLVRERCELEHALSWLSTLGGAFSALGDYFPSYAEVAGKISLNQIHLAFRLGDPNTVSRCKLFLSLSLIQRRYFKLARKIIHAEYCRAKSDAVVDERLLNMCKGIWCKLRYELYVYRKYKKAK